MVSCLDVITDIFVSLAFYPDGNVVCGTMKSYIYQNPLYNPAPCGEIIPEGTASGNDLYRSGIALLCLSCTGFIISLFTSLYKCYLLMKGDEKDEYQVEVEVCWCNEMAWRHWSVGLKIIVEDFPSIVITITIMSSYLMVSNLMLLSLGTSVMAILIELGNVTYDTYKANSYGGWFKCCSCCMIILLIIIGAMIAIEIPSAYGESHKRLILTDTANGDEHCLNFQYGWAPGLSNISGVASIFCGQNTSSFDGERIGKIGCDMDCFDVNTTVHWELELDSCHEVSLSECFNTDATDSWNVCLNTCVFDTVF